MKPIKSIVGAIIVFAVLVAVGFAVTPSVKASNGSAHRLYESAMKIESVDEFEQALKEDGRFYAQGDLIAINPVNDKEISGEYSFLEISEQTYRRHEEKTFTGYDEDGYPKYNSEEKWDWEEDASHSKHCSGFVFLSQSLGWGDIRLPSAKQVDTVKFDRKHRNVYNGVSNKLTGVLEGSIKNGKIFNTSFHNNRTIEDMAPSLSEKGAVTLFWSLYSLVVIAISAGAFAIFRRITGED